MPRTRSRHETPSSGSTRSMPIHSGPPHRHSYSSSSSDYSSNRRTTNTSPSASPNDSSGYHLSSRKPSPERPGREDHGARYPPSQSSIPSRSPYDPYPYPEAQHTTSAGWSGYGHQAVKPLYASDPNYQPGPPAVVPHPGYQATPGSYTVYNNSPTDLKHYSMNHAQQPYAVGYSNVDNGEPRSKKRRGNLPKWQTDLMRSWYNAHIRNPYPTESEKHQMVRDTGLTLEQAGPLSGTPLC